MPEQEFLNGVVLQAVAPEQPNSVRAGSWRAYRILIFILILRPLGNLSLAFGMKQFGEAVNIDPMVYLRAMLNPYVAIGISFLVIGLLMRMALLSVADLSFVLPLSALGYIVTTILGRTVLHEEVSWARWVGTILIFAGTAVVSAGKPREVRHEADRMKEILNQTQQPSVKRSVIQ